MRSFMAAAVSVLALAATAFADVSLPSILSDNMVLQRGVKCSIWGNAQAGEKVSVTFGKVQAEAQADEKGAFKVELPAMEANSQGQDLVVKGSSTVTLKNVLVGEVWVCSGQSNMQWQVANLKDRTNVIKNASRPTIRLLDVPRNAHSGPMETMKAKWVECSPQTIPTFSSVAYFFGCKLNDDLKVPVGLISSNWGGTGIQCWIPVDSMENDPALADLEKWRQRDLKAYPEDSRKSKEQLAAWTAATQAAAATQPAATLPARPRGTPNPAFYFGAMYNGMISPLTQYQVGGAIWYQGEANTTNPAAYLRWQTAMIGSWRKAWGREDLPFVYVQLANFMKRKDDPNAPSSWAQLRQAQLQTLAVPNTAMAVAIDVGDAGTIHPDDKVSVGNRLALAAMAIACGKKIEYMGPIYKAITVEDGGVRVSFTHLGDGLVARGDAVKADALKDDAVKGDTVKGDTLKGFAVAGQDMKFVWAQAKIDGDTVVVSSDKVASPVAVRYAYGDNPECNLYNKAGLPASPFEAILPSATSKPAGK